MDKYCLEDYTSNYMYRLNLYNHQKRIGEIKNRRNVFLPKIGSKKSVSKSAFTKKEIIYGGSTLLSNLNQFKL